MMKSRLTEGVEKMWHAGEGTFLDIWVTKNDIHIGADCAKFLLIFMSGGQSGYAQSALLLDPVKQSTRVSPGFVIPV